MQCTNHLKQITLATHNYHDVTGGLPAGQAQIVNQRDDQRDADDQAQESGWGTFMFLTPYMELTPLWEFVTSYRYGQLGYPTEPIRPHWGWNNTQLSSPISTLQCPSDGNVGTNYNSEKTSRSSYRTNRADGIYHNGNNTNFNLAADSSHWRVIRRCPFPQLFWHNFASIEDGTSNTLAFSESVVTASQYDRKVKATIVKSTQPSPDNNPLTQCAAPANVTDPSDSKAIKAEIVDEDLGDWRGRRAFAGTGAYAGFTTVYPPNYPSCISSQSWNDGGFGIWTPTSNHSGGVNTSLLDGSVRFVSETVNYGTLSTSKPTTGPSPYGVWGAMGAINGGESTTF